MYDHADGQEHQAKFIKKEASDALTSLIPNSPRNEKCGICRIGGDENLQVSVFCCIFAPSSEKQAASTHMQVGSKSEARRS